jgi:hypothetical protein
MPILLASLYCLFGLVATHRRIAFSPALRSLHVLVLAVAGISAVDADNWPLAAILGAMALVCLRYREAPPRPINLVRIHARSDGRVVAPAQDR